MRYYVDGEAIYAGLVYWEGYYYYINSSKKAVQNVTYTTSTTNGLLPVAAYTFDEYGRMTNPPDGSYGRLAGTEDVTITYQYDANGMRTGKTVTRTDKETGAQTVHAYTYIYNGSQLSQMTVDGHTLRFSYDSGKPMFVKYDGVTYQYILNLQGDVIGIMNHAGTVVVEYVYDAWGNILSVTGSHASTVGRYNPLRYRSYVFDSETGLYYLQSRYYNPEWGRFINADSYVSTGQGILGNNMFAYCRNNPVCRIDISGTADEEVVDLDGNPIIDEDDIVGGGMGSSSTTGSSSGTNGGGSSSGSPSGTYGGNNQVTLFRAMSSAEYTSTMESQQFAAGDNSYEHAKYFATSYTDATKWGDSMYPEGDYKVLQASFDSAILSVPGAMYLPRLDGIGPAYLIPLSDLNNYVVCLS